MTVFWPGEARSFRGTVQRAMGNGTFMIKYDDGDEGLATRSLLGQWVEADRATTNRCSRSSGDSDGIFFSLTTFRGMPTANADGLCRSEGT